MIRKLSFVLSAVLIMVLMSTVVFAAPAGEVSGGYLSDEKDTVSPAAIAQNYRYIGYDDYYDDNYYDYDDYGYDFAGWGEDHVRRQNGFSGTLLLIAVGTGAVVALTFYLSTKSSYENAGIGAVYDLKDNALLKMGSSGKIDRKIDTRSSVDRGFYTRNAGPAPSQRPPGTKRHM